MQLTHRAKYEGALVPRFYGLAYREPAWAAEVYYLIPFNLLVRWWMGFWCWVVWGRGNRWDRALEAARRAGFHAGLEIGRKQATEDALVTLNSPPPPWSTGVHRQ